MIATIHQILDHLLVVYLLSVNIIFIYMDGVQVFKLL
nr:MAG TPA: hypothetical protein [Caudoviricetes sp.]